MIPILIDRADPNEDARYRWATDGTHVLVAVDCAIMPGYPCVVWACGCGQVVSDPTRHPETGA